MCRAVPDDCWVLVGTKHVKSFIGLLSLSFTHMVCDPKPVHVLLQPPRRGRGWPAVSLELRLMAW